MRRLLGSRHWLIGVIAALLLNLLANANAQPAGKPFRIGTLDYGSASARAQLWESFNLGLRELGYVEGQNLALERRWADGTADRLLVLADELVKLNVDVIAVAGSVAAQAAARATSTIPIVFMGVAGDPVQLRLVASLARPGANATGLASLSVQLTAKRLDLLREALPKMQSLAVLWDRSSPAAEAAVREVEAAAQSMRLRVVPFGVNGAQDLDGAFAEIRSARADAVLVASGAMFFTERRRLAGLALKHQLPTTFSVTEYADAGGLFAYGVDLKDEFRRAASYVDKIRKGARPADLPVEQPTRFELTINLRSANALALKIPQSLLLRADRVIGP